ncbi:hypothetical protein ACFVOR_06455 [Streptomyces sp. NPDC057837]
MLEQVTTVMPVWEAYAKILTDEGYSVDHFKGGGVRGAANA